MGGTVGVISYKVAPNTKPQPKPANTERTEVITAEKPFMNQVELPDGTMQTDGTFGGGVVKPLPPGAVDVSWGKAFNYRHGEEMTAIEHIMYRHSYNSGFSNVSKFAEGTNVKIIKGYVDQAIKYGTPIQGGFEYNFGKVIGTGSNGAAATSIRVYIRDGWIRTAFPF